MLKKGKNILVMILLILSVAVLVYCAEKNNSSIGLSEANADEQDNKKKEVLIDLPKPTKKGKMSVEESLQKRRSRRDYKDEALTLAEVSQILWAAQGITNKHDYRTAPSAGATFPLEVYAVVGNVKKLPAGVYKYKIKEHKLTKIIDGDKRAELSKEALEQTFIKEAAFVIVISAVYERTSGRYGDRAKRYVHMEVGHVGQNIYLQAESMKLGTVAVAAFYDNKIKKLLKMPKDEVPLYIMPVGKPK